MYSIDLSKYNSAEELFNENKKKYLIWWILFTAFLGLILFIQYAAIIEQLVNKDNYINGYQSEIAKENLKITAYSVYNNVIIGFTAWVAIFSAIYIWHIFSFVKAYNKKDYSQYSFVLTGIFLFAIIFQVLTLVFSGASYFKFSHWDISKILKSISTLIYIIVYFAVFIQCNKTIKIFRALKIDLMQRNIQNDPYYQMFQNIMGGNFSQMKQSEEQIKKSFNSTSDIQNAEFNSAMLAKELPSKSEYRSKLELLDHEQLITMAEKLNIFGSRDLTKEQLVDKIASIFEERTIQKEVKEDKKEDDGEKND
ncbi:hypothetical protein AB5V95_01560 [Metamycoplasma spumans]|uniref:hypothetical protein n=1 Tax=Metamycoplasma spumans TaxID=92406 RepID=UPI0034DCF7E2